MTNSFKTYYVSQIDGNDTNDGLSKSSAFATLFAINRLTLQPGDRVLLARGSVFEGQFLQIKDSGTKESPIEIGAYLPESGEKFYDEVLLLFLILFKPPFPTRVHSRCCGGFDKRATNFTFNPVIATAN